MKSGVSATLGPSFGGRRSMAWADLAVLAIIGVSAVLSLFRGFVREAIALAGWIAGLWFAFNYHHVGAEWFVRWVESPQIRDVLGFVVLLAAVLVVAGVVARLAGGLVDVTGPRRDRPGPRNDLRRRARRHRRRGPRAARGLHGSRGRAVVARIGVAAEIRGSHRRSRAHPAGRDRPAIPPVGDDVRDRGHRRARVGQPVALRHAHRPAAPGAGRGGHRHVRERPPALAAQQRDGARRVPRRSHARSARRGGDRSRALPDGGRGGVLGGAALLRQLAPRHRARAQRKPRQRGRVADGPGADRSPAPEHGLRLGGAA